MDSLPERFQSLLNSKGLTPYQLAKRTNVSNATLSRIINAGSKPNSKTMEVLCKYFGVTEEWLLTGKGDAVNDLQVFEPFEQYSVHSKNGHQTFNMPDGGYMMKVPLIPIKAHARYISEGDSAEFIEGDYQYVFFKVDHVGKGKYAAFEIKGDSFWNGGGYDTPDKAIALGRDLDRSHWKDGFRDSELGWIIVTHENIVLKDIISQDLQKGEIVCHSRNPSKEYSDFTLSLDNEVKSIWKVIKRQF